MTDIDAMVTGLFPTPIYRSMLRPFTDAEMAFVKGIDLNHLYDHNVSKNSYLLEEPEMADIKTEVLRRIDHYYELVVSTSCDVTPRLTQSWINVNRRGQFHHLHTHPNSLVSGTLYFQVDEGNDGIVFKKPGYQHLRLTPDEPTDYNRENFLIPVTAGLLVMFPGDTYHNTGRNQTDKDRISMAFNSFVSGSIGEEHLMTKLSLPL